MVMPLSIVAILASIFTGLLCLALLLNIFGLPANWIILGLIALWQLVMPPNASLNIWFWAIIIGLAIVGEVLETGLQFLHAKKYGSSSSGTFAGIIGGIIGAIIMAPLFWGIGALLGALAGAWLACLAVELLRGSTSHDALNAAFGTLVGRLLGTLCKIATGAIIIAVTTKAIWPEYALPLPDSSAQIVMLPGLQH